MKSLSEFLQEQLELSDAINPEHSGEIILFYRGNSSIQDEFESICQRYASKFSETLTLYKIRESIIFKKFISNIVDLYKKEFTEHFELNYATKKYIEEIISADMLEKILQWNKINNNKDDEQ